MAEIIINDVYKSYNKIEILKGVSFELNSGEKVGLLGKNGSGKTTLLKVIIDREPYQIGNISISKNRTIALLDQIPSYPAHFTVKDVLLTNFERVVHLSREMKRFEALMQQNPSPEYLKSYGAMQTEFEAAGGYTMDSAIDRVCNGLGIKSQLRDKPFSLLSGGEKTRANLARILLCEPDILLLDEPTNHLDIKAIEWLEEFIHRYKGAVLVISHDRFFLDKTVTRILELVDGKIENYPGNYSFYANEKKEREQAQAAQYEQQQKKIDQLEKAAKKLHEWANMADNPAIHKRASAIEKRIEKMDKVEKPREERQLTSEFSELSFSGNDIILLENVNKIFGDKVLLHDINGLVRRNERVAVIGDNGTGKTTLLKLIMGELQPDSGTVKVGNSVQSAYLQQLVVFDNPEWSVLETVRYTLGLNEEKARQILAAFHFKGKDVSKSVRILSGGEKSRLRLCILMQTDCNLLIMDEPTNHLDLDSREWIEKAVLEFKGSVIFVSHDRYFINKFASRIWELRDGTIYDFRGSYHELYEIRQMEASKKLEEESRNKDDKPKRTRQVSEELSNRKKEIKAANDRIKLESQISELEERINLMDNKLDENASNYSELERLVEEKSRLAAELDLLYAKWMEI